MKLQRRTRQIHQIATVNRHWPNAIFLPQSTQSITMRLSQRIRLPLPRAGRKYLESIGSQPVSTLRSHFNAARCGGVYADTSRSGPGRFAFRPQQNILHAEPFAFRNARRFLLWYGETLTLWLP